MHTPTIEGKRNPALSNAATIHWTVKWEREDGVIFKMMFQKPELSTKKKAWKFAEDFFVKLGCDEDPDDLHIEGDYEAAFNAKVMSI